MIGHSHFHSLPNIVEALGLELGDHQLASVIAPIIGLLGKSSHVVICTCALVEW